MDMIFQLLILALGFVCLVKGADWFVDGAVGIATKFGIPQIVIGLTIVAMMIFIEMSVFTQAIPWKALVTGATIPESFTIRPFALFLFIASTWALTKKGKRLSIMAVIFISAVLGAIFLKC